MRCGMGEDSCPDLAFSLAENAQASVKNDQRIQPFAEGDLKWAGFCCGSQISVNCSGRGHVSDYPF